MAASKISEHALKSALKFNILPFKVSDDEAIQATLTFLEEYKTLVEPACGAALAIPYFHSSLIERNDKVLVIVCGGVNTLKEKII